MSTVTNTQVAVKYRQNVGSLSINMSADNRTTTLGRHNYRPTYRSSVSRHIDRCLTDTSADISSDTSRSTYRPTLDRYVNRHIGRHSADMSTDTSVDCRSICRPICRSRGAQNSNTHDPKTDYHSLEPCKQCKIYAFFEPCIFRLHWRHSKRCS